MDKLSRRRFLRNVGLSNVALVGPKLLLKHLAGEKLNFVFILIDDMGRRDLGCFGSHFYASHNIDKLASQGMRFTNAYAAFPVCSPTRAQHPHGKISGASAPDGLDSRLHAMAAFRTATCLRRGR